MSTRTLGLAALAAVVAACADPSADPAMVDPFASADAALAWEAPPPPTIALTTPPFLRPGRPNAITITGDIANGERVYLGGSTAGTGRGPCLPVAGGKCLSLRTPVTLLGSVVASSPGSATFTYTPAAATPAGTRLSMQALIVRSIRGVDSILTAPVTVEIRNGPPEGTVLTEWTDLPFADTGYRDGCAGGAKWVKSTDYASPKYVGVTLCDDHQYKIWMSDTLYGTFVSVGDWSGSGEDQCEYVGGEFDRFGAPAPTAVDPNQPCWSRGPSGVAPVYEPVCANNRWIATSHVCSVPIPGDPNAPAEGSTLPGWTAYDLYDDGYRNGCDGGEEYVKSTPWASPKYVGVTLCGPYNYKIWLSDRLTGIFHSAGDWSGSGEDHCDLVGGEFDGFPVPATAVDPGESCWSRSNEAATPVFEASCSSNRWVPSEYRCSRAIPGAEPPADLSDWQAFDFYDNDYRNGCAGGAEYIKATAWPSPGYVGVTLCDADTYKIWLSDDVHGIFVSPGDWSGSGEDHCEYTGGSFTSFPTPSTAVTAGEPCWSRGPAGVAPVYEATCASNRWVPSAISCTSTVP